MSHTDPPSTGAGWLRAGSPVIVGVVALAVCALNAVWLLIDRTSPSFDQASYLRLGVLYQRVVGQEGITDLWSTVHELDPSRGPLYTVAVVPWLAVFGDVPRSALAWNVVLSVVTVLAAGDIARRVFGSDAARLVAVVLTGLTPILVGLQHNVLVDYQLVAAACLCVMFLVRSDGFTRLVPSLLVGVSIAIGTVTKVTFPAFVVGPVVVVVGLLVARTIGRRSRLRPAWLNLGASAVLCALLGLPWYVANRQATLDYIRSTTGGELSAGAGPEHPLTLHNMASFVSTVLVGHLGLLLAAAAVLALVVGAGPWVAAVRGTERATVLWKTLLLGSWAVIPFLALLTAHNQDVRLMAPAFPAVAIATAGGLVSARSRAVGRTLVTVVVVALVLQTVNRTVPIGPGWLPDRLSTQIGAQTYALPVASSEAIGYQGLPLRDRATPILDWVERRATTGGVVRPENLCMLVTDPVVNGNTFGYLTIARRLPFTITEVVVGPDGPAGLPGVLDTCDVAFYIKPPADLDSGTDRLSIVNQPYAASYMTRKLIRGFDGPHARFRIDEAPVSAAAADLSAPRYVTVLTHAAGGA